MFTLRRCPEEERRDRLGKYSTLKKLDENMCYPMNGLVGNEQDLEPVSVFNWQPMQLFKKIACAIVLKWTKNYMCGDVLHAS